LLVDFVKVWGRKFEDSTAVKCSYNFYQFVSDVEEKNPKFFFFIFKKYLIVFGSVLYYLFTQTTTLISVQQVSSVTALAEYEHF
jgi:hypothetical protein